MDFFISWSGERGRLVATAFRDWLPLIVQTVKPWMSPDLEKGKRWDGALAQRLATANVGMVCITADSRTAPWILYEAGAVGKALESRVFTFLLDVESKDLPPPLGAINATRYEEAEILKLAQDVNSLAASRDENVADPKVIHTLFSTFWPRLDDAMKKVPPLTHPPGSRTSDQLLEEVLDSVRLLMRTSEDENKIFKFWFVLRDESSLPDVARRLMQVGTIEALGNGIHVLRVRPSYRVAATAAFRELGDKVKRVGKPAERSNAESRL